MITTEALDVIKRSEAYRRFAYPDPASPLAKECRRRGFKVKWGFSPASSIILTLPDSLQELDGAPWTCGYGETLGVDIDTQMSLAQAAARLEARVLGFEQEVRALCTVAPNINQVSALVSLAYNIGIGNLRKSSVLKAHNRGDFAAASRAFALWNKAGGEVLPGLVSRRAEEAALYLRPVTTDSVLPHDEPIAQTVDPEKPLTQSNINRAATVAGGTAALSAVADVMRTLDGIGESLHNLLPYAIPLIALVTVVAVGYIIYERVNQRKNGVA